METMNNYDENAGAKDVKHEENYAKNGFKHVLS